MSDIETPMSPKIYLAHHKPLPPRWEQFLCPIRVGNYQDLQPGAVTDNTGDHIAAKNREYAELTALYWIWKNDTTSTHVGFWHYGRWMLPDAQDHQTHLKVKAVYYKYADWLKLVQAKGPMLTEDAIIKACAKSDVILPYWEVVQEGTTIEEQFDALHPAELREAVYKAFDKLYPDYPSLRNFMQSNNQTIYCNMAILRRDLLDDYCNFLFPLLTEAEKDPYIESLKTVDPDSFQLNHSRDLRNRGKDPRWAGCISERLLAYYAANIWMKNKAIKVNYWHMLCFWY